VAVKLLDDGWLAGVECRPSPNVDDRPPGTEIDLLVVHNISLPPGTYGGGNVQALFTNRLDPSAHPFFAAIAESRVSSHLLIERDGRIVQFASFGRRAWHAGVSAFEGRPRCNDYSIGVELEGTDFEPFSDAQYDALNEVLLLLCARYPLRAIRAHSDIAPGRKTDPGPFFDWSRLDLPASVSASSSAV
jgi:AmpD protein